MATQAALQDNLANNIRPQIIHGTIEISWIEVWKVLSDTASSRPWDQFSAFTKSENETRHDRLLSNQLLA